jgi:TusA-related sulfurtransferase
LKRKVDHTLDFRGTITPISLLKATQVLREMKTSETMEILGCDPDTLADLLKVLPASSYELTSMEAGDQGHVLYRIQLKKTRVTWP